MGLADKVERIHLAIYRVTPLRWLTLLMALVVAGSIMWNPTDFAHALGGLYFQLTFIILWATCSGVIYGVNFFPRRWYWQIVFTPYVSILVLAYTIGLRFL